MTESRGSIAASAILSTTARVWDYAQIREGARIGERVVIARNVYIGSGVEVGDDSKIQNSAMLYEPAFLGCGVFIGPGVILTNDRFPRACTPNMTQKQAEDWDLVGVNVLDGASIGAGAICVAPITIGRWSMVAAGAVVVRDVPDYGLVVGNPARQVGWVGRAGKRLVADESDPHLFTCPDTGDRYEEQMSCLLPIERADS